MDILSYLSELIKTRKEVGIAGLGTIYKKKSPGRYDAETHSFLPPSRVLDFSAEVQEDRALSDYISRQKGISFDSSAYYVSQFAEDLLRQLRESGQAELGDLGTLHMAGDAISFAPAQSSILGFDFYGLPALKDPLPADAAASATEQPEAQMSEDTHQQLEAIQAQNELEERLDLENANADTGDGTDEFDEQPVYEEISEPVRPSIPQATVFVETPEGLEEEPSIRPAPAAPVMEQPAPVAPPVLSTPEEKNEQMPLYVKVIIAGVIFFAAAIALYVVKPELFDGENRRERTAPPVVKTDTLKKDSVAKADSLARAAQTQAAAGDTLRKDSVTSESTAVAADTLTTWEVIGASVLNEKEVRQTLGQFKKTGITGKVIPNMPGKRRIKISIATFYDEAAARKGRAELVIKLKNPELYIYQNKHTHKPE